MFKLNKGLGAGGKNTTIYGKQFESVTDNLNNLYSQGFIKHKIKIVSENYAKEKNIEIGSLMPISISKYFVGKEMGIHVDSYGDERSPVISVVAYLNDDYQGGELYFPEHDFGVRPKKGMLILVPGSLHYVHGVAPITSGTRYTLSQWCKFKNFKVK